jgi:hypothetical protein
VRVLKIQKKFVQSTQSLEEQTEISPRFKDLFI